ncbi:hypothetical protein BDDG_08644 [Blastomyces dermatitidis ATCC 18188]|uniref:DUF7598 domain-containing protein n=1 Tax=Ajellomyces dermatitidis (strain ATCC 18188 / CBS 674.68) TaxID=653446 RepID=F2TR36_AJEDA|nr:hypothetical protein BDDG_08644 [Blastomyces dermatitidis ATCC 18188]
MTAVVKSLAGPGYIILNAVRVFNIICLLCIIAACSVLLIKTSTPTNFFVFDAMHRVIIIAVSMFLIISEVGFFEAWFHEYWGCFGRHSSFLALGITMVLLGISTIGCLNREDMNKDTIGFTFWQLVLGAGIITIVFGFVNIAVTFIYRTKKTGLKARHIRTDGAVAPGAIPSLNNLSRGHKSFRLKREDSLPVYRESDDALSQSKYSRSLRSPISTTPSMRTVPSKYRVNISQPIVENHEQFEKFSRSSGGSHPEHPANNPVRLSTRRSDWDGSDI